MTVKTFDMKRVRVTVDGIPVTGWAAGEAVTIEWDEDSWTKVVGADGEVLRSRTNNNTGKVTLKLLGSSTINEDFAALKDLDDDQGLGLVEIVIEDLASRSKYTVPEAWIMKEPPANFGAEAQAEVEWVFDTGQIKRNRLGILPAILQV